MKLNFVRKVLLIPRLIRVVLGGFGFTIVGMIMNLVSYKEYLSILSTIGMNVFYRGFGLRMITVGYTQKRGVIYFANHHGALDISVLIHDHNTSFIMKKNVNLDVPIVGKLCGGYLRSDRVIVYERGNKDSGQMVKDEILDKIKHNKNVMVFPEGSTTRIGDEPLPFKEGIMRLAYDNNIPMVPVELNFDRHVGARSRIHDDYLISKLVDVTLVGIFKDPIIADDKETYEQYSGRIQGSITPRRMIRFY